MNRVGRIYVADNDQDIACLHVSANWDRFGAINGLDRLRRATIKPKHFNLRKVYAEGRASTGEKFRREYKVYDRTLGIYQSGGIIKQFVRLSSGAAEEIELRVVSRVGESRRFTT